jgi:transposase
MLRAFLKYCKSSLVSGAVISNDDPALSPVEIDWTEMACPECHASGCFKAHGSYWRRFLHLLDGRTQDSRIEVSRVKCTSCGHTHAIAAYTIVAHSSLSVLLVAAIMKDRIEGRYSSLEALAEAYLISLSTLQRLIKRFMAAAKLFFGQTGNDTQITDTIDLLARGPSEATSNFLESFYRLRGRSFLQA